MKLFQFMIGYILLEHVFTILSEPKIVDYLPSTNKQIKNLNTDKLVPIRSFEHLLTNNSELNRSNRLSLFNQPWRKNQLTWNFLNKSNPKSAADVKQIRKMLTKAFKEWQKYSQLKVYEINNELVDIKISFEKLDHGDGSNFDGIGLILAHAFRPNAIPPGGEIHFDEDELWDFYNNNTKGANFLSVALHETGHALGLLHSSVDDSVMNQVYRERGHKLHEDDKLGIQELYGFKEVQKPKLIRKKQRVKASQTTAKSPIIKMFTKKQLHDVVPDTCNTSYDAIALIRNELFIFKRQYMWRLRNNVLLSGYPVKTRHMWNKLPKRFTNIDAVFENRIQKEIWFFIGIRYFVFNANQLKFKRRLTHLGLPKELKKIDAIFTWGRNNVTYIFSGENFWRLDDKSIKLREKNSKKVTVYWRNALEMDTAFQKDGKTYFFKNKVFYEFDDSTMKLNLRRSQFSSQFWMKCQPMQNSFNRKNTFYW